MKILDFLPDFFKKKDVQVNAAQLYLNKALNAIVPFFLIPLYNKVFGVEKYGELIFIQAITTLLIYFTDFGFVFTATREVSVNADNKGHLSSLVSSVMLVKISLTVLVFIGLFFFGWATTMSWELIALYALAFLAVTFQNFMPSWFFQGMKRNSIITFTNLLSKIVLVLLVWLFVKKDMPLWIVPLVDSLSFFIFFVVGLWLVFKSFKLNFVLPQFSELKENFRLSGDNFLITLMSWVTTGGVLIVTEQFVSDREFGYYGIFTRICYYIFASAHQINLTVFPYISERFSKSAIGGEAMFKSVLRLYLVLIALILIPGLLGGKLMFSVFFDLSFNQNLDEFVGTFYVLIVWVCVVLLNNFIGLQFFVSQKKDSVYRKLYLFNVIVTLTGCLILSPRWGILGSAISAVIGECIMLIFLMRALRNERRMIQLKEEELSKHNRKNA